jgi:hypothetical protein
MIKSELQNYNRNLFEQEWNMISIMLGNGDNLTFPLYRMNAYNAADAQSLVSNLISCAATDTNSLLQDLINKISNLIIEISLEALKLENTTSYGEIEYESKDEWLWSGRMFTYESLAFALWFKNSNPNSEWWLQTAQAIENYYLAKKWKKCVLAGSLEYFFMSGDYQLVRDKYFEYEVKPLDIDESFNIRLRKLYDVIYLCSEFELHGKPSKMVISIQKSIDILYNKAQDWRISMLKEQRMIIAYLRGRYITGEIDPLLLAKELRGF